VAVRATVAMRAMVAVGAIVAVRAMVAVEAIVAGRRRAKSSSFALRTSVQIAARGLHYEWLL